MPSVRISVKRKASFILHWTCGLKSDGQGGAVRCQRNGYQSGAVVGYQDAGV